VKALLRWFSVHKRAMPWRDEISPYRTWISEIMLQQTQVEVVRSYFSRFMKRFADVHALASADERDVLSLWAGLGYYSRARNLHRAARMAVEAHGGLPPRKEDWAELPGIGPYTLGAVRSIAYGEAEALVDGNVVRVISRITGEAVRRGDPKAEQRIWAIARETLLESKDARKDPGVWNQALMELGALVCSPESPKCLVCPVRSHCKAFASGEPTQFPLPKIPAKRRAITLHAAWIERNQQVLLVERKRPGLWAGMWAFPSAEGTFDGLSSVLEALGAKDIAAQGVIATASRVLTHRDVELHLYRVVASGRLQGRWVQKAELACAGLPSAFSALLPSSSS